ncbi:hypothetical protein BJV77DRAFT_193598 [Russula vinacea]|nr:hypothetical protein BJV77DRAFT_193598 [Russula vinacea]
MSQHQISQVYYPSLRLMFAPPYLSHSAQLFQTSRGSDPVRRELRTVSFPHSCLNRFASIASIKTGRNRETWGLFLGKDKDRRYVVTTLLIPK